MQSLLVTSLAALAMAAPADLETRQASCATGVHVIAVRGTWESQTGSNGLDTLVANITAAIPKSDSARLVYPALAWPFGTYEDSVKQGDANLVSDIKSYAAACPKTPIVILGYSQGGQVAMDAICGNSEGGNFTPTTPLSTPYLKNSTPLAISTAPLAGAALTLFLTSWRRRHLRRPHLPARPALGRWNLDLIRCKHSLKIPQASANR